MHASSIIFYELESAVDPELSSLLILTQSTQIVLLLGVPTDVISVRGTEWADNLGCQTFHVCNFKRTTWSRKIQKHSFVIVVLTIH